LHVTGHRSVIFAREAARGASGFSDLGLMHNVFLFLIRTTSVDFTVFHANLFKAVHVNPTRYAFFSLVSIGPFYIDFESRVSDPGRVELNLVPDHNIVLLAAFLIRYAPNTFEDGFARRLCQFIIAGHGIVTTRSCEG